MQHNHSYDEELAKRMAEEEEQRHKSELDKESRKLAKKIKRSMKKGHHLVYLVTLIQKTILRFKKD